MGFDECSKIVVDRGGPAARVGLVTKARPVAVVLAVLILISSVYKELTTIYHEVECRLAALVDIPRAEAIQLFADLLPIECISVGDAIDADALAIVMRAR